MNKIYSQYLSLYIRFDLKKDCYITKYFFGGSMPNSRKTNTYMYINRDLSKIPVARKHESKELFHCPWRATVDLVRGRVSARVSAGPLALSRYTFILRCLLSGFDWTSRYQGTSSKMITTQGVLKTASSGTLLP